MDDISIRIGADTSAADKAYQESQKKAESSAQLVGQKILDIWDRTQKGAGAALSAISVGILAIATTSGHAFGAAGTAASSFTDSVLRSAQAIASTTASITLAAVELGKYTAAASRASSVTETLVSGVKTSIRAYELVTTGFAASTFALIGFGIAAEAVIGKVIALTNARAKLIEQQSLFAAVNQVSVSSAQRADAIQEIGGGSAGTINSLSSALSSRIDSNQNTVRSGLDTLGISRSQGRQYEALDPALLQKIAEGFASIEDPAKRAAAAVSIFGKENAGTALQELTPAFVNAAQAVDKYGLTLDSLSRNQIYQFRRDIKSLETALTDFSEAKGWWQSFKQGTEVITAAAYDMSKRAAKSFDDLLAKILPLRGALSNTIGDLPKPADPTDIIGARISFQKGLVADDFLAEANAAKARQDATLNGQRALAEAAREHSQTAYQKLADDAKARSINPKNPDLLSPDQRFDLTLQQKVYAQQADLLARNAEQLNAADEARLTSRNSVRSANNSFQEIVESERSRRARENSVGPLSQGDFENLLLAGFDKVTREINSKIEEQRIQRDPKTGDLRDVSGTEAFRSYAASVQAAKPELLRNEYQRITFEQEENDTSYYRDRLNHEVTRQKEQAAKKAAAKVDLDSNLTDQSNRATDRQFSIDASQAGRDRTLALERLDSDPQTIRRKIAIEDQKLAIDKTYADRSLAIEIAKLNAAKDYEIETLTDKAKAAGLKTDGISGAVSENYDQQIAAARKANADDDLVQTLRTQHAKTKIIEDENLKQFESFKQTASGVLDAVESHTKTVFQAIGGAIKATLLTAFNEVVSSQIAAGLFRILNPGTSIGFERTGGGVGPLGKDGSLLGWLGLGRQPSFGGRDVGPPPVQDTSASLIENATLGRSPAVQPGISFSNPVRAIQQILREAHPSPLDNATFGRPAAIMPGIIYEPDYGTGQDVLSFPDDYHSWGGGDSDRSRNSTYTGESLGIPTSETDPFGNATFGRAGAIFPGISGAGYGGAQAAVLASLGGVQQVSTRAAAGRNPLSSVTGGLAGRLGNLKDYIYNSGEIQIAPGIAGNAAGIAQHLGGGIVGSVAGGVAGFAASPAGAALGGSLVLGGLSGRTSVLKDASTTAGGALTGAYIGSKVPGVGEVPGAVIGGGAGLFAAGIKRGGIAGIGEDTVGGAVAGAGIGFVVGGPIGAAIGAGIGAVVGAAAGVVRLFVPTQRQHIIDLVKQIYRINISNDIADQIDKIAQSGFAGKASVAIRSTQVQELLSLYAQSTGQNFPLLVKPQEFQGAIQNGGLYQVPTSLNGQNVGFNSTLPTIAGSTIGRDLPIGYGNNGSPVNPGVAVPSGSGGGGGQQSITLNLQLDGDSSAAFLQGQTVAAIGSNPRAVAAANNRAQSQNSGRLPNQGAILSPTTVYG